LNAIIKKINQKKRIIISSYKEQVITKYIVNYMLEFTMVFGNFPGHENDICTFMLYLLKFQKLKQLAIFKIENILLRVLSIRKNCIVKQSLNNLF